MTATTSEQDYDIDALEEYLLSLDLPEETMTLSELDGYLTAVALAPSPIPSEEWLPEIWGGEMPPVALQADSQWVVGAITAHYAAVRQGVAGAPDGLDPILDLDRDEMPLAGMWADGFVRGVGLRKDEWLPLLKAKRGLGPIGVFTTALDSASKDRAWKAERERMRGQAAGLFAATVARVRNYWASSAATPETVPPAPPALPRKVARNAVCPCESGKKYKRCCGA